MRRVEKKYSLSGMGLAIAVSLLTVSGIAPVQAQTPGIVAEGYSFLERGWVNDAITSFRQAVQQYPQSIEAQLGLAIAYQRAGQDSEAWTAYQRVLTLAPENQTALTAVGLLGSYRPEWQQQGITALTTLLSLNPLNTNARAQRALLYGYQGQFAAAIEDYELLLPANPPPEVILGAAQVYTYSGAYTQGLSLFERYLTNGRTLSDDALTAYALSLQETGSADRAVQILSSRLNALSSSGRAAIPVRTALAVAYQKNGQLNEALTVLQPLRNNETAILPLARALSAIGRAEADETLYGEAVSLYRQALEQSANPSVGLQTEVADVLSEDALSQPQALFLYDDLLTQQPQDQSLQVKRWTVANAIGQISRAELYQQLQTILQVLPDSIAEQRALAQALIRVDPPAPELLSRYEALLPSSVSFLYFRIAQIHLQQNDLDAAQQALANYAATSEGTQDLAIDLMRAEIDRRQGNLNASVQRYETILATQPRPAIRNNALRGLAGIRLAQGELDTALTLYDQLLADNPDDRISQLGRASIGYQTGQISQAEAKASLDRWLATEPVPEPPPELFNLVGALPPDPEQQRLYEALLEVEPNNLAVNRRLVQVLAAIDPQQARTQVEALVNRNPDNLFAYFIQGEVAQSLGDLALASQAYEAILIKEPNNTGALAALGGVRFQQKQYAEATALYEQVLALKPQDWETRRVLAELRAVQGQPLLALAELQQVQQLQTDAGISDPQLAQRIEQLQIDLLRRRGFQPSWERY